MNDDRGKHILGATFFIAINLITFSELKKYHEVPRPARYVGSSLTWGILALISPVTGYGFTSVFSLGLLLMLITSYFEPGNALVTTFFGSNKVTGQFVLRQGD